jgi:8-oxo-dGTP diphosphatase
MVAALSSESLLFCRMSSIENICESFLHAQAIIIDIPIGLPDTPQEADARPDAELRRLLKGKASSVFNTPCRQAVYARDKRSAKAANQAALGKSLSEQSLGLVAFIRSVDSFLISRPEWREKLLEGHPEYGFMLLNGGKPVLEKKRTPDGQAARVRLLEKHVPGCGAPIGRERYQDDAVDALCLAVIGMLGTRNGFHTVPAVPDADANGIPMRIMGARI